jgi:hypothetical protein
MLTPIPCGLPVEPGANAQQGGVEALSGQERAQASSCERYTTTLRRRLPHVRMSASARANRDGAAASLAVREYYRPRPLQLSNLNAEIRVDQLKLPVVW